MTQKAVVFLLDRSGSMGKIKASTIESFNAYLATLRTQSDVTFTLVTFDSTSTDTVHRRVPMADVPDLTDATFQPRHSTPLIDAECLTIDATIESYQPTDKVVLVFMTDGEENASTQFKRADLLERIKKIEAWGWQTVFLGASIDAYSEADKQGIGRGQTMSYDSTDAGASLRAYSTVAAKTTEFFEQGTTMSFSDDDKAAAGDKYADRAKALDALRAQTIVSRETKTLVDKPSV